MNRVSLFLVCSCWAIALELAAAGPSAAKPESTIRATPHHHDYFKLNGGLQNSRICFERKKSGRVAFLGGSITNMKGWREMTYESLKQRFPEAKFDFVHAGIPSVDSTGDAFRLSKDVFAWGQVDLLFVEASVNDYHNGRNSTERVRAMEGIVRQARRKNPNIDIVFMCFVDQPFIKTFNSGKTPAVVADHLKVAKYYNIPSIDLAREVTERIAAGEFQWAKFRNCHPSPFGHALYHSTIERMLATSCAQPLAPDAKIAPHRSPPKPMDEKNYQNARFLPLGKAELVKGWKLDRSWKPTIPSGTRPGFVGVPMLVAEQVGATLKMKFTGSAVGIFVVAGPDAGTVEFSIDGGPRKKLDQFTRWSGGLYLPWAYVLDAELDPGEHELTLTTIKERHPKSKGNAARIVHFMAN